MIPVPREGALYHRVLADGEHDVTVYPMTFGKARLCLSLADDECSIIDGWCYEDRALAIRAAVEWSGEGDPLDGWTRHLGTGRRRDGGNPAKETVRW
jgi:hypothetical protein